jgi:hypothetical protein
MAALGFVGYQIFRASGARTYASDASFKTLAGLADRTENGVRVEVALESDSKSQYLLCATFTPTDDGFHLYGKDLDPKTVDGLGMPTKFEIPASSSIKVAGSLFANVPTRVYHDEATKVSLPVYPDGPVTLRLPIEFGAGTAGVPLILSVSYMACDSKGTCLKPVESSVHVMIPRPALPQ